MNLIFGWKEIKDRNRGLTFDDVLLVPVRSNVRSRRAPVLKSQLTKRVCLETPIISANMDTVTEATMAKAMHDVGGLGILHRFMSIAEQVQQVRVLREASLTNIAASIGVNEDYRDRAIALVEAGCNILTLDIAHGHSVNMIETMKWVKDKFANVDVIAGNIATAEGAMDLIENGADAIKVGIGPGSMCTTRIITGCGVPQLTAIAICAEVAEQHKVPVIADGGMRNSGDLVKAFAAGASTIMLGSMLAGCLETPGEVKQGKKQYRGMASKAAQTSWRGGVPEGMAPEGESTMVPIKGHVRDVIREITGGIRSGMSYLDANQLDEIRDNAHFIEMSHAGSHESHAHGLQES